MIVPELLIFETDHLEIFKWDDYRVHLAKSA